MKSIKYLLLAISIFAPSQVHILACGPYAPIIPTPSFFELPKDYPGPSGAERNENLRLWQSLTSQEIPLTDIEQAVYKDSQATFDSFTGYGFKRTGNLFYTYINNTGDEETIRLLSLAKELEEQRRDTNSPWYYPRKYGAPKENGDFSHIINTCRRYCGSRLKDRFALQMTRALFASRQYAECAEYVESAFAEFPDDNLMKRMALRYAAGCWTRLGDTGRANIFYARTGDIRSLRDVDPVEFMAQHNPNAPQLIEYLRSVATDSLKMIKARETACRLISDRRIKDKGDWYFLLSFISNEYERKPSAARNRIYSALNSTFSSSRLHDLAYAYKMKMDAKTGCLQSLLPDLKWFEKQCNPLNPDAYEWIRRLRNIIYVDLIPRLWRLHDYSTAIHLCAYADFIDPLYQQSYYYPRSFWNDDSGTENGYTNIHDYCSLSFQMMQSLSSNQLIEAHRIMAGNNPLHQFLRRKVGIDRDYFYELIGTLAIREENFPRAVYYLKMVDDNYLQSMNINTGGYLARNPFTLNSYGRGGFTLTYDGRNWTAGLVSDFGDKPQSTAKLEYARKMMEFKRLATHGKNADDRGLGRLLYAIGRINSFGCCWALTQYWNGWVGLFEPYLDYWDENETEGYAFLFDFDGSGLWDKLVTEFDSEVDSALLMLASDESRAKAQYVLGNLKTIIKRYPDTKTAGILRTSCDRWSSWL
jgi:hypothetical protein